MNTSLRLPFGWPCALVAMMVSSTVTALGADNEQPQGLSQGTTFRRIALEPSVALDFYAPAFVENGPPDGSRARVRSIEVGFSGAVDPAFDATVTIAGHDTAGVFAYDLHEGFFSSSLLIPSSRIKIGKMLLNVGRLNRTHQHAWPFISAPRVQERFFSAEAVMDTALEYTLVVPFAPALEITAGVATGHTFGHTNVVGAKPLTPTHYLHPIGVFDLDGGSRLELGATYLGRTDRDGTLMRIAGIDLYWERRDGGIRKAILQSELYHRYQKSEGLPIQEELGTYLYGELCLNQQLSTGLRLDGFTRPSLTTASGARRANLDYALVPVITYRASEASAIRASYTYATETMQGTSDRPEQRIEIQLTAMLGTPEPGFGVPRSRLQ